jgi:hypothetical protein
MAKELEGAISALKHGRWATARRKTAKVYVALRDPGKHEVWIVWGKALMDTDGPTLYTFNTEGELLAFLRGVEESNGWMDYAQFDTKKEAQQYIKDFRNDD